MASKQPSQQPIRPYFPSVPRVRDGANINKGSPGTKPPAPPTPPPAPKK